MLSKTILIGRLGNDPVIKHLGSGKQVCNFNMATTSGYKDNMYTEWHRIVVWDKSADIASKYLHKGSLVYVEGENKTRSWEDNQGNIKYTTEIICRNFKILDSKSRPEEQTPEENVRDDWQEQNIDDMPF